MKILSLIVCAVWFFQMKAYASPCAGTFTDKVIETVVDIVEESGEPISKTSEGLRRSKIKTLSSSKEKIKQLKESAKQGDLGSQVVLGTSYLYGDGVSVNYKKALNWYKKAAKRGNIHAQYNLGLMYMKGYEGIPVDKKQAAYWLELARWGGHILAEDRLKEIKE